MKKLNKVISVILSAILIAGLLPTSVFAEDTTYNVKIYATASGYATITNIGGTISGEGQYRAGETVTLTATPNDGYCAISWSAADSNTEPYNRLYLDGIPDVASTETEISFTMPAQDVYITGSFREHNYIAYTDNADGSTHDVHCYYCGKVQTASEPHIDETTYPGYEGADGLCDKCGAEVLITLDAPTNPRWDTSNGTVATWDAVDGATSYTVELWKKDIITLHLLSHNVSDTSFEFYLSTLSAGSYYFTVRAVTEDIKSNEATSDDIIITSGGTPILINGSSERVDSIDGTAFIVGRDDIVDGSVSEVDMTPITVITTLTNEQAAELIAEWITSWEGYPSVDTYKDYIRPQLEDYSLADLEVILNNIDRGIWPNDFIADVVIEEIEAREVTSLIIDPNYIDSNADKVTVNFGGTQAEMNNDAMHKILDNLGDGNNVKISVKNAGSEVLPKTLTEQGPYGGSEAAIDKSIFKATGIENIEDRLQTLGLINGNTDSSVTEEEFEYLYHYLTTDELTALKNELNESAHFEHHQNAVNWLTKMIERDNTALPFTYNNLLDYADFTDEQIAVLTRPGGISGSDYPTLGELRELGLTLEQMKLLQSEVKELRKDETSAEVQAKYDALLAWLDDAIAQKELEQENATITSMTVYGLKKNADLTDKQMQILYDMGLQNMDNPSIGQIKKLDLTLEQMKLLYAEIDRTSAEEHNPVYRGEYDVLLKWLEKAIAEKEQENKNTPTYVQVGGTSDGINPIFIGAVDVNIGAVKADGTTNPIAIKADRSDACAWSTYAPRLLLDLPEWDNNKVRAYKVLENDTLESKGIRVVQNADGTLTLKALSDGNSTYVFLLMPGYEITLNENYSDGTTTALQTGADGKLTSIPTPKRSGYNFLGWYDAEGNEITTETVFTDATEVYAKWQVRFIEDGDAKTIHTVKFDTNGGNVIAPAKVENYTTLAEPDEPTKDGYTFAGWYSDKTLSTEYNFDSKVIRDLTLYAKWEAGTSGNPFEDVDEDDWYYDEVLKAYNSGFIAGTSGNAFSPNGDITRAMFVTMIYRAEGEPESGEYTFNDVESGEWYTDAVAWASENEIVYGYSEEVFAPNDKLTREQLAAILYRYAEFKGYDTSVGEDTNILSYADFEDISEWAIANVQWACGEGIITGKSGGILDPLGNATRAEATAMLMRFVG